MILKLLYFCFVFCFIVPPEIHLLTKRMSQTLGKETILTCMISASPQAVGVWHKNGQKIESDWKIRSEIYIESPHTVSLDLKIMNLEEKDFGFYTCEASNELGGDSERMLLYGMILYDLPITIVIYMELHFLHNFFNICFVTEVKFSEEFVLHSVGFCYIIISSSNVTCFLQDIIDA